MAGKYLRGVRQQVPGATEKIDNLFKINSLIYKFKDMKKVLILIIIVILASCSEISSQKPLNVLLIIVDDENAWLNSIATNFPTPGFELLAHKSLYFSNAYCAAPACAPSRTAMLTGLAPTTTGAYYNNQNLWANNTEYAKATTLPDQFKKNGYTTACFGKILHPGHDEYTKDSWSEGYYFPYNVQEGLNLQNQAYDVTTFKHPMWYFGKLPDSPDSKAEATLLQDTRNVNRVLDFLEQDHKSPFFVALGIYKPHGPWYIPKRFFDKFPLEDIKIPEGFKPDDLNDVPECAKWLATHRNFHDSIVSQHIWKKIIQAYQAAVSYSDDQLMRAVKALENSEYKENTIVVLVGDNGFHLGEKDHWSKFALWQQSTKVPIMIKLPGKFKMAGKIYPEPVSLLDIYPTLVELTGIQFPAHELDGTSLMNTLKDGHINSIPVLSTHGQNCNAVIKDQYYYIQYRNGAKELYNMEEDPFQWQNLAADSSSKAIINELSHFIPHSQAPNLSFQYGDESSKGWSKEAFK